LKPLELSESFRSRVRTYPKATRRKIGAALQQLEEGFGQPHAHRGLGIRRLAGNYFEIRVGLDLRLIFQNHADSLLFLTAGSHDEIQKFLRGI
jgi:mRNA-degrading endonuclease YafQ of YafQ-DinJ toxin-antitoxin module